MRSLLLFLIVLVTSTTFAAIYVNQEKNGGVEYTDTPTTNSSIADVPPVNTVGSQLPASSASESQNQNTPEQSVSSIAAIPETTAAVSSPASYKVFQIASPVSESTIQNQATIPIEFTVEPKMLPGDKIQVYLDGKPTGTPTGTTYQELGFVERGTHTLGASIMNKQGQVVKTAPQITIFVHRNSAITSPAMQR